MRTLARFALWWLALFFWWLLIQGDYNRIEKVAASCAAALGAAIAVRVRSGERAEIRLEGRWVLRTLRVPWQVVREFGIVTLFLGRTLARRRTPRTGGFRTLEFPTGGARPAERGRRVLAALAMTYSPNSYVVELEPDTHEVVVHTLSPVPPGQELI
jgi:multisubunit Na+/H+ antiporter MnhE subunit